MQQGPKIVYSAVARGTTVLAEHSEAQGNFSQITLVILKRLADQELVDRKRHWYQYNENKQFAFLIEQEMVYMCMSDIELRKERVFGYLDKISSQFKAEYADTMNTAGAFTMNDSFSRTLERQMQFYSFDESVDAMSRVKSKVEAAKGVLLQNIDMLLERGEIITLLVEKTEQMEETSFSFNSKAGQLKRHMWWKNLKLWIAVGVFVAILLFLIITFACGGFTYSKCRISSGSPSPANTQSPVPLTAAPVATAAPTVIPVPPSAAPV